MLAGQQPNQLQELASKDDKNNSMSSDLLCGDSSYSLSPLEWDSISFCGQISGNLDTSQRSGKYAMFILRPTENAQISASLTANMRERC